METVDWKHTETLVDEASDYFAEQAKLELQAKRPRTSIRAKWAKVGNTWQPTSARRQIIRKNFVASGQLVGSIEPEPSDTTIAISANKTSEYVINGRKKGRYAPVNKIDTWAKIRGLRPRDPETGEFIKNTNNNKRAMRFLMNRKIKFFGIDPFDFVGIARDTMIYVYEDKLIEALKQDIIDNTAE